MNTHPLRLFDCRQNDKRQRSTLRTWLTARGIKKEIPFLRTRLTRVLQRPQAIMKRLSRHSARARLNVSKNVHFVLQEFITQSHQKDIWEDSE